MKSQRLIIAFLLVVSLAMLGMVGSAKKARSCDRQGLVDLMQKYVRALADHSPKDLPFAEKVKFTENTDKGRGFASRSEKDCGKTRRQARQSFRFMPLIPKLRLLPVS